MIWIERMPAATAQTCHHQTDHQPPQQVGNKHQ
jgi:hypothetical protein